MLVLFAVAGCEKIGEAVKKARETGDKSRAGQTGSGDYVAALTAAQFDEFVGRPDTLAVVDFHADWCPPCRKLGPVLERVCADLGPQVALAKVNVDKERELASKLGVRSIPDVRIFRAGRQVDGFVGARPEPELRALLSAHLAQMSPASGAADEDASEPAIQRMEKDWVPPGVDRK